MAHATSVFLIIAGFTYAFAVAPPLVERMPAQSGPGSAVPSNAGEVLSAAETVEGPHLGRAVAEGKRKVADADADVAVDNTARAREEARLARADAKYAVAIEKCKGLAGVAAAQCLATGKAVLTEAWVEDNVDNNVLDRAIDATPARAPERGVSNH